MFSELELNIWKLGTTSNAVISHFSKSVER